MSDKLYNNVVNLMRGALPMTGDDMIKYLTMTMEELQEIILRLYEENRTTFYDHNEQRFWELVR